MIINPQFFSPLKVEIERYLKPEQVMKITEAYELAYLAHSKQSRSSGEPYITHPVAVATILAKMYLDYETIIAAVLHDTIEDTYITYDDIVTHFGKNVAVLVDGVSKLDKLKFRNRAEAQAENFRKMVLAMAEDVRVILIKLADRTHNMNTLSSLRKDKQRRIAQETLEIYVPLAHRLGIHHIKNELENIAFETIYPYRAQILKKIIEQAKNNRNDLINEIFDSMIAQLSEQHINNKIIVEERSLYEIYQSMRLKEQRFQSILDIYAFIIIADDKMSCYQALGCLHSLYKPKPYRFKDYVAIPKINGYQSLHTSLIGPRGSLLDVRIRTAEMDEFARLGVIAHCNPNHSSGCITRSEAQENTQKWLKNLLELQKRSGNTHEFIDSVKSELFPKEIYVFTPKGKIIGLPSGSTPLDFAYFVHTEIGNHCIGARVDRKNYPLSKPLKNGQTIEIQTNQNTVPNITWLNYVATSKAKSNIRQALKLIKRDDAVRLGKLLFNQLLTSNTDWNTLEVSEEKQLLKSIQLTNMEDIYHDIGVGNLSEVDLFTMFKEHGLIKNELNFKEILVSIIDNDLIHFENCCHPIPNDPIVGMVNMDKGLAVHHTLCKHLKNGQNKSLFNLTWDIETKQNRLFTAEIRISVNKNAHDVLPFIITYLNQIPVPISWIQVEDRSALVNSIILNIDVRNSDDIDAIILHINAHADVISVLRNINYL